MSVILIIGSLYSLTLFKLIASGFIGVPRSMVRYSPSSVVLPNPYNGYVPNPYDG